MKKFIILLSAMAVCFSATAKGVKVQSPNGRINIEISDDGHRISYKAMLDGKEIFVQNDLCLKLADRTLGRGQSIGAVRRISADRILHPCVPVKQADIRDRYNGVELTLKGCKLEFRVMDNAVAYRFVISEDGQVQVMDESFNLVPSIPATLHYQANNSFRTSYEALYEHLSAKELPDEKRLINLPAVFTADGSDLCMLVSESDVRDYPGMFLTGGREGGVVSQFPKCPLEWEMEGDRAYRFTKMADYIALTEGSRSLPWRYVTLCTTRELMEQTITAQLGGKSEIDASWVKPGQVSWDWWNWKQIYGEGVDFEPGCNTPTYKYYIDFAAKYGLNWIILDEGWANSVFEPFKANPDLNLHELISYGKERGVGIILWLTWTSVQDNLDTIFKTYEKWGVAGVKVDFMDRSDQWMVNYYERVVKEAAAHHILVDFHGAFKPSGLEQRYPNLLSYEGVRGMEYNENCTIENTLYIPFIRNAVGPADFTPGAMITAQPEYVHCKWPTATWVGTRAFTMALYIVLESGIQMLSDCPTHYYQNEECTEFITKVPATWDETRCLAASFGKMVIVAKRKGDKWYIGGIAGGDNTRNSFVLKLDFLGGGSYTMESFSDGFNAHRQALDYRHGKKDVKKGDNVEINMARNGGFAAVITKNL